MQFVKILSGHINVIVKMAGIILTYLNARVKKDLIYDIKFEFFNFSERH
jgi:hypothetical protein